MPQSAPIQIKKNSAIFGVFDCFSPLYGQILGRNPGNMSSHKKRSHLSSFRDFLSFSNFLAFWGCSALHSRTNAEPNNTCGFEPHTAHGRQGPKSGGYDPNMFFSVSEAFCEEIGAPQSVPELPAASQNRSTKSTLFGSDLVPGVLVPGLQPLVRTNTHLHYSAGTNDSPRVWTSHETSQHVIRDMMRMKGTLHPCSRP